MRRIRIDNVSVKINLSGKYVKMYARCSCCCLVFSLDFRCFFCFGCQRAEMRETRKKGAEERYNWIDNELTKTLCVVRFE